MQRATIVLLALIISGIGWLGIATPALSQTQPRAQTQAQTQARAQAQAQLQAQMQARAQTQAQLQARARASAQIPPRALQQATTSIETALGNLGVAAPGLRQQISSFLQGLPQFQAQGQASVQIPPQALQQAQATIENALGNLGFGFPGLRQQVSSFVQGLLPDLNIPSTLSLGNLPIGNLPGLASPYSFPMLSTAGASPYTIPSVGSPYVMPPMAPPNSSSAGGGAGSGDGALLNMAASAMAGGDSVTVSGPLDRPPPGTAMIRVRVPESMAKVRFNGRAAVSLGRDRFFVTPRLPSDQPLALQVAASWKVGDQSKQEYQTIQVEPGKIVNLDFTASAER